MTELQEIVVQVVGAYCVLIAPAVAYRLIAASVKRSIPTGRGGND